MIEGDALAFGLDESPRKMVRLSRRRRMKALGLESPFQTGSAESTSTSSLRAIHIDAVQDRFDSDWHQLLERGTGFIEQGKLHLGVSLLTRVVNRVPDHVAAWHRLGFAYGEMGRRREAIMCFDKVVELEPDWAEAWNNRGWVKLRLSRFEEAIEDFKKAIAIDPMNGIAWFNLGAAYVKTGDDRSASDAFRKASSIDGTNETNWFRWAQCCARLGDREGAAQGFRQAATVNPNHIASWIQILMRFRDVSSLPKLAEPALPVSTNQAPIVPDLPNVGRVLDSGYLPVSQRGVDTRPKLQIAWQALQNPVAWILVLVFASLLYILLGK